MARLLSLAATAASLLSLVHADVVPNQLLGFDESLIQETSIQSITPEITYLTQSDFTNSTREVTQVSGWFPSEEEIQKRFINGADDRYQFSSLQYPFSSTGKLYWDNGVFCSGALIGPRHVLTAKHCLVSGSTGYFAPAYDNGEPFGRGVVTNAFASSYEWGAGCGYKGDWAVLILDTRLGDQLGYFGVKYPDASLQDQAIFDHVGYPGDLGGQRPYRTPGNTVQSFRTWDCDSTGPYYTDTDCQGGQSGGPHWENTADGAFIWGTLSVTFDGGNGVAWSGWGSGNEMLDAVVRYRSEFP